MYISNPCCATWTFIAFGLVIKFHLSWSCNGIISQTIPSISFAHITSLPWQVRHIPEWSSCGSHTILLIWREVLPTRIKQMDKNQWGEFRCDLHVREEGLTMPGLFHIHHGWVCWDHLRGWCANKHPLIKPTTLCSAVMMWCEDCLATNKVQFCCVSKGYRNHVICCECWYHNV